MPAVPRDPLGPPPTSSPSSPSPPTSSPDAGAGPLARAYARMSATRPARFVSRHVAWKVDPVLLRATGGRLSTGLRLLPTALLETRGARTGRPRRHAVIRVDDGDRVVVAASNAGAAHHPAWFHNLLAHPDVVLDGERRRATVVEDEAELRRLWARADRAYPPFATYRREAAALGRTVPLVVLTRADGPTPS